MQHKSGLYNDWLTMGVSEHSNFVLAIDGGQSSTLALIADTSGYIYGSALAGPSNHIHEPGGPARLEKVLHEVIRAALQSAGKSAEQIKYACLGMTGGPHLAGEIARSLLPGSETIVHKDVITALAGASVVQPGVIVIAGTGAVAYGQLSDGRHAIADGWGYLMGDEGSAYDIGLAALKAASRADDGRGQPTLLLENIPAHFGLSSLREVHRAVYSYEISRPKIATIAAVVSAAAHAGDMVSRQLLYSAGSALGNSALAVISKLDQVTTGMTVYTTGGVFKAGKLVLSSFTSVLKNRSSKTTVQEALFSPAIGALFLALQAAGVELNQQVIQTIKDSVPDSAISKHTAQNN